MSDEIDEVANNDLQATRRSSRAIARPNFKALESGDDEFVDEQVSSDSDDESYKRKKRRNPKSASHHKHRYRKTAGDEVEFAARQAEADVAALTIQAEAWKRRYEELSTENEALKNRIQQLTEEAEHRDGKIPLTSAADRLPRPIEQQPITQQQPIAAVPAAFITNSDPLQSSMLGNEDIMLGISGGNHD